MGISFVSFLMWVFFFLISVFVILPAIVMCIVKAAVLGFYYGRRHFIEEEIENKKRNR